MSKTETAQELIDSIMPAGVCDVADAANVGLVLARRVERVLAEVQRLRDLVGGDPQIPAIQIVRMLDGAE